MSLGRMREVRRKVLEVGRIVSVGRKRGGKGPEVGRRMSGKENEGSEKERTDGDGRKVSVGSIKKAREKGLEMHEKEVERGKGGDVGRVKEARGEGGGISPWIGSIPGNSSS